MILPTLCQICPLSPGAHLILSVEKIEVLCYIYNTLFRWWTALLEGEAPIDPKSIESVLPMNELQDEEQMKLHELMFNQEQKLKGLPTSEEQVIKFALLELKISKFIYHTLTLTAKNS
jgi:hypothetical protein